MNKLSADAKHAIVQKVLAKDGRSMTEIAKAHNIGCSTLSKWVRRYRNGDIINNSGPTSSKQELSLSERFQHLLAVAALDDEATGSYCREHGLYSFQLDEWRKNFMSASQLSDKQKSNNAELQSLRIENKQLKQEVRRKDCALAEASALLILKKKATLIWGESEDV
jgi:transposase-like protein